MANEFFTLILTEYPDFANFFFPKLVSKLFEYIIINNHAIELIDEQ